MNTVYAMGLFGRVHSGMMAQGIICAKGTRMCDNNVSPGCFNRLTRADLLSWLYFAK
jgi:hypothetical protein